MQQIQIWYVVSEAEGLVKSGGLADVAKALPKALAELNQQVALVLPAYQSITQQQTLPIILSTQLEHWPHTPYQVLLHELDGVPVYLIEQNTYFDRPQLYGEANQAYADNGERFGFFSAASLDVLPKLKIKPNIVHVNDWHTGLVPFLLKTRYQNDAYFSKMKSVLTIHNAVFKGEFSYQELAIIPELQQLGSTALEYGYGQVSLLKAGILYADKLNAVSPNYAQELLTPLGSHGLSDVFLFRKTDLCGILNGCDYSDWNPRTDPFLPQTYSEKTRSMQKGKAASKALLQQELGLPQEKVPLFGMVCRLTHQKGFHYLLPILAQFLRHQVQVVIIGTGDPQIAQAVREIANQHPTQLAFLESYSNRYAHLIEAGSDFFLMPSEFEACGLNQIYSMAYGTLPIVREVGGLKDSVVDYDADPEQATGFSFKEPTAEALLIALQRVLLFYLQQPKTMQQMQQRAMEKEFSWQAAAKDYLVMYQSALK